MRFVLTGSLLLLVACSGGEPNVAEAPEAPQPPEIPEDETFRQWALPSRLHEISGLALTEDERLLAVTDEVAVVFELDYESGRLVKTYALGNPTVRGDFEGIAVLGDKVWLMTSDGELYSSVESADGERVGYERYKTGIGKDCELEGLVALEDSESLALICKDERKKKKLRIYVWTPASGEIEDIKLPEKAMEDAVGRKQVKPSGIAVDPGSGDFIVVAARQHAIFRLSRDADKVDVIMRLDPKRHSQAEGITVTRDGRMIVADEGGNGRPRLAVYRKWNRE